MGPLAGIQVIELPNIGPVQFAGMLLSDLGAEVLRVDRATDVATGASVAGGPSSPYSVIDRGRRSVGVDLKHPDGAEVVLRLCERADVLLEGFRPGVAERLGVGPDACRARNPRLVYARMTGWGQDGPLAGDVGHDINYLSIAGVLWHLGPEGDAPVPPINLLADFGGGGSLVVMGILAALVERGDVGRGSGRRRGDGRRQRAADEHLLRARRDGRLGPARHQPARRRRALLQRVRDRRRRLRLDRRVRAEVLRELPRAARPARLRRPRARRADGHARSGRR